MRPEIEQLCRLLKLDRRGTLWHGSTERIGPARAPAMAGFEEDRAAWLPAFSDFIYFRYYVCGGFGRGYEGNALRLNKPNRRIQLQELRQFIGSSGESDWQPAEGGLKGGGVLFESDEAQAGETDRASNEPAERVVVPVHGVRPNISAGFVFVRGPRPLSHPEKIARTYVNIPERDRVPFAKALYTCLLERDLAFDFKTMFGSEDESRCDNVVLYCSRNDHPGAIDAVYHALASLGCRTRELVPLWTYRLSPGVAVADDPASRNSFGRHCSEALAAALASTLLAGQKDPHAVEDHLARAGFDLDQPYLEGRDQLNISETAGKYLPSDRRSLEVNKRTGGYAIGPASGSIHGTLEAIANHLHQSSLRRGGRLSWLIPKATARPSIGGADASLYSGLAGIASFLCEYARVSEDRLARQFSGEIWAEIMTRHEAQEEALRLSLLNGSIGTALAGGRSARILSDDGLFRQSALLLDRLRTSQAESGKAEADWLGGLAGAISGLNAAGHIFENGTFAEWSASLALKLSEMGKKSRRGVSWQGTQDKRLRPMLGMAHGVSGIALALAGTGELRLQELARQAFDYEDSFFSEELRAWPVFRNGKVSYTKAWCHGDAGILLSRRLAQRADANRFAWKEDYARSAESLWESTLERLPRKPNLCLCHGLAGNTEILQLCGQMPKQRLAEIVHHVCVEVEEEIRRAEARGDRLDPSLMLGLSGVGLFLLRQLDPDIPSPFEWGLPPPGRKPCDLR